MAPARDGSAELDILIEEVKALHHPLPPASREELRRTEERLGCPLPADLRQFYESCGGAHLFPSEASGYEILEPDLLRPVGREVLGEGAEKVPSSWLALCYVQDGNYVAIDLPPKPSGEVWIIDCFHETIGIEGYSTIIAVSFAEFLRLALQSDGKLYWLESEAPYGDAFARPPGDAL
jgi:cell wall assembly regulator SMI1